MFDFVSNILAGIRRMVLPVRRRPLLAWQLLAGMAVLACANAGCGRQPDERSSSSVQLNAAFVDGLYTSLDFKSPRRVFETVFASLGDNPIVYPSEGCYYFKMAMNGQYVGGTISFPVEARDTGFATFNFVTISEDKFESPDMHGPSGALRLDTMDGCSVTQSGRDRYDVSYQGRTVHFRMYMGDTIPPAPGQLLAEEEYVGPSFDESGLRFYLLFNRRVERLYWMLNESGFVPEQFRTIDTGVVLGGRTGFVFYSDTARERKILIGVDSANAAQNNWYDGPFDELPDSYIQRGTVRIKQYLVRHYGLDSNTIDRYGRFKRSRGIRVPVAPYHDYGNLREFTYLRQLRADHSDPSTFLARVTGRWPRQPQPPGGLPNESRAEARP